MKRLLTALTSAVLTIFASFSQTLAFPTAEGFGKYASGGRGGEVVEVTNLLDDPSNPPAGSLRWALKQHSGKPITVVFRVSGIIDLKGHDLRSKRNDVTIAGQTAPGDGICLKGGCMNMGGSRNVIVRYMRFRQGILGDDATYQPGVVDASNFIPYQAFGLENGGQVIIDHCSFSWSAEEIVNLYDNDHTTLQWCIIDEGLYNAGHGKGNRSFGAVWGGKTATYHHNLLAHNYSRSPRIGSTTKNDLHMLLDLVNNVNYNWGRDIACYGGDNRYGNQGLLQLNFVGNYYKPGPARPGQNRSYFVNASFCAKSDSYIGQEESYGEWHLSDNYMEGSYAEQNGFNTDNYKGFNIKDYTSQVAGLTLADMKSDHIDVGEYAVATQTAAAAYESVLAKAGAFPRDSHDARVVEDVRLGRADYYGSCGNGSVKGIIDKPSDSGGYPTYRTYGAVEDADHDGMADSWELANGFDPTNANDRNTVLKGGYTALEAYLCSLVGENIEVKPSKAYDFVVAKDGTGDFTTINAAIEAADEAAERTIIFVRNGLYEEKVFVGNRWQDSKKVISIIGESRDGVIISWDDYQGKQIDYPGKGTITADGMTAATMTVTSPGFYMENVTVRNTVKENVAQAQALYQAGDRQILKNVTIEGYQDTHRTKKGRRYFLYDCTVKGNTDFIYGGGTAYFYKCEIVSRGYVNGKGGGYVTAPEDITYKTTLANGRPLYYEFVFNDCDLTTETAGHTGAYLARPWADHDCGTIFLNSRIGNHIAEAGWAGAGNAETMSFAEYKSMNPDGSKLDVSKRVDWSMQLSEADLALFDLEDVYGAVNQSVKFEPEADVTGQPLPSNVSSIVNGRLTWDAVEGAIGYAIYDGDRLVCFSDAPAAYLSYTPTKLWVRSIAKNGALSTEAYVDPAELHKQLNPNGEKIAGRVTVQAVASPVAGGKVEPASVTVEKGATVSFTATPSHGYLLQQWQDADGKKLSSEATYSFVAEEDAKIKAVFVLKPVEVSYHKPTPSDGLDFELTDLTQVPEKDSTDEWVVKDEFADWITYNVHPVQVGGRSVQLDPKTGETVDYYTYGTNNMIRVGQQKWLTVRVANTTKARIYFNGAASTAGHLVAEVAGTGVTTQAYESKKEVGKKTDPQSDYLELQLDDTKEYAITLKGTQDMALWALCLWPGANSAEDEVEADMLDPNEPVYDVRGIRVTNLVPGTIYIQKGRKFVIR